MVILTLPVEPEATTAVKEVEEKTVKEAAAVPPKLTAIILERLVPVMITFVPVVADKGVKEEIVGAAVTI